MTPAVETISNNRCKILIICAGMAGLSAAGHLVRNGVTDFKILEARNSIGGRIVSTNTSNHKIELSANWIHGVLGNPMYLIAMEIYDTYVCFFRRCEEYFLCHYSPPTGINSVGEHISLEAALYLDRSSNDAERPLCQPIFDCLTET